MLVRPLITDRDLVIAQVADVGRAGEKPEELMDDRGPRHSLRGHERKALVEVEPDLPAEDAQDVRLPSFGAQGSTLSLACSGGANLAEQVEVLLHKSLEP